MVDLYREWKCDEWCELLYNNIWVFIDSCKSLKINPCDRWDIESEAIMEWHQSVIKSLDKSYWQIYNYVKTRIIWRIKNYYIKEARILKNYFDVDMSSLECDIVNSINSRISDKVVLECIVKWILSLSEVEKESIYLRIFNFPGRTLQEIENISWIDKALLSRRYVSAVSKIKNYLANNWLNHEDLL